MSFVKKKPRIGLYGGSFDPIHHGHLILARDALEQLELDKVLFIPAYLSPHKTSYPPASPQARWEMLLAAIENEPHFEATDIELQKKSVSYTFSTVLEIQQQYPEAELFYFIGQDNLKEIHTWYRIEELVHLVRFVIFSRNSSMEVEKKRFVSTILPADTPWICRNIEISSSQIRERVTNGLSIRYFMPEKSLEVLYRYKLYV